MTTFEPINPKSNEPNSPHVEASFRADDETLAASFDLGAEPGAAVDAGNGGDLRGGGNGAAGGGDVLGSRVFTKDEFFAAFVGCFKGANMLVGFKTGAPLKALDIADNDASARAASDAIYDTALEVPWLNWLLSPGNKWVERIVVIGAFGFTVGSGVAAELKARRPEPPKPGAKHQAVPPSAPVSAAPHVDGQPL